MAGYFSRSGGRKVSCAHLAKSRRGQVASLQGTRSGHDIVYRIGSRMSGQPSCTRPRPRVGAVQTLRGWLRETWRRGEGGAARRAGRGGRAAPPGAPGAGPARGRPRLPERPGWRARARSAGRRVRACLIMQGGRPASSLPARRAGGRRAAPAAAVAAVATVTCLLVLCRAGHRAAPAPARTSRPSRPWSG